MSVIASCGCKIPESRYNMQHEWDGTNRDYSACVCSGVLCVKCEEFYKDEKILRKITKTTRNGELIIWERRDG